MDNCGTKRNEALKIILAAIYFLQINSSSNWRWRSEADSAEEFADDSNAFLYFRYLTKIEEGMRGMSLKMLIKLIRYFETDANTILGSAAMGVA